MTHTPYQCQQFWIKNSGVISYPLALPLLSYSLSTLVFGLSALKRIIQGALQHPPKMLMQSHTSVSVLVTGELQALTCPLKDVLGAEAGSLFALSAHLFINYLQILTHPLGQVPAFSSW